VLVGSGRDRRGIQVISAVLGTSSEAQRDEATMALLRRGLGAFQRITAVKAGTEYERVPIAYRRGAELPLIAGTSAFQVVPRGHRDDVKTKLMGVPAEVEGPIVAGQAFGRVDVIYRGKVVSRVPLVAESSVPAADLEQRAKAWFTTPLPILLAFAVLAGTVLVGRQLRRSLRNGRRSGEEARAA
jgi:serine-type D-Ala-D-Ala carboxypeptidase (penicillin-binding protein 5/6)